MAAHRFRRRTARMPDVSTAEERDRVTDRLRALEDAVGAVRHTDDDTTELLIEPPSERVIDAELVADTIARLRALELYARNRERRP